MSTPSQPQVSPAHLATGLIHLRDARSKYRAEIAEDRRRQDADRQSAEELAHRQQSAIQAVRRAVQNLFHTNLRPRRFVRHPADLAGRLHDLAAWLVRLMDVRRDEAIELSRDDLWPRQLAAILETESPAGGDFKPVRIAMLNHARDLVLSALAGDLTGDTLANSWQEWPGTVHVTASLALAFGYCYVWHPYPGGPSESSGEFVAASLYWYITSPSVIDPDGHADLMRKYPPPDRGGPAGQQSGGAVADEQKSKMAQIGRPRNHSVREKILAHLKQHHKWYQARDGEETGVFDPLPGRKLASLANVKPPTVSKYMSEWFGSQKGYKAACRSETIIFRLTKIDTEPLDDE